MDEELRNYLLAQESRKNPWIAGILQFFLPGAGYFYLGKYIGGAVMLLLFAPLYYALYPLSFGIGGLLMGLLLFFTAANETRRYNRRALLDLQSATKPAIS
jgi:VIT1/CCC1 family predicted Fe2+/Mn2+ transporter